ncbi:hypothetical protein G6F50_018333 [Rhizopus delemar]|uniref:Uncharacterized protein n=1 Tax=Rhizopus delemar TaxID=936053 RepID=A0A9P7BZ16_9FUNG|nr:hypothetical protein G6F50_018333 [Rhizopus delemar]
MAEFIAERGAFLGVVVHARLAAEEVAGDVAAVGAGHHRAMVRQEAAGFDRVVLLVARQHGQRVGIVRRPGRPAGTARCRCH